MSGSDKRGEGAALYADIGAGPGAAGAAFIGSLRVFAVAGAGLRFHPQLIEERNAPHTDSI